MIVNGNEPASTGRVMGGADRCGLTHKVEIVNAATMDVFEGYVTGNVTPTGELREVFLHGFGKEGSTLDGWAQFAAISLSLGLQAGANLRAVAVRVAQVKFEPYGRTDNPAIPWTPSVPAYVMAWLALRLGDEEARAAMRTIVEGWSA